MREVVAVAMSGGVDSSVTAAILKKEGYEVIGLTMKLFGEEVLGPNSSQVCGANTAAMEAKKIADALGIPHHTVHLEDKFRKDVIDPFIDTYLAGRTPIPCAVCNKRMKFDALFSAGEELGARLMATGHYVRREVTADGTVRLFRGADAKKDQSYFLFSLSLRQLKRTLFPLGGMEKDEVRTMAASIGLHVAEKAESQEICFIPADDNYINFINRQRGNPTEPGDIVNTEGKVLGRHQGIFRYTIGQRRGLGIPADKALYVLKLDAANNQVVVGYKEELNASGLIASDVNWIIPPASEEPLQALVKIRHNAPLASAWVNPLPDNRVEVRFEQFQKGIAPGQAAVFYDDDVMLGGGWIRESFTL